MNKKAILKYRDDGKYRQFLFEAKDLREKSMKTNGIRCIYYLMNHCLALAQSKARDTELRVAIVAEERALWRAGIDPRKAGMDPREEQMKENKL